MLGSKCFSCGSLHGLVVDVVVPMTVEHHSLGNFRRWKLYLALAPTGQIQLLCGPCHRRKSRLEARTYRKVPFAHVERVAGPFSACDGISPTDREWVS